jgi:hypothetical protein
MRLSGCCLQAVECWEHNRLSQCFIAWRERTLVQQQYNVITRVVTNKRVNKLLLDAWTAWQVRLCRLAESCCGSWLCHMRQLAVPWHVFFLFAAIPTCPVLYSSQCCVGNA